MKLRVAGVEITKWQNLSLTILFDSIKSVFSVDMYWNPFDKAMRLVMLPGGYNQITIVSDNDEVLFTGVLISPSFKSSARPALVNISGYSLTGVLDDAEFSAVFDTTQTDGKSFYQICQAVCGKFGFKVVDRTAGRASRIIATSSVSKAEDTIERSDADRQQTCAEYLADLARGLNIVLSHDNYGNLVLNYGLGKTEPVFNFSQGMPGVEYELSFDGAQMHSLITAASQPDHVGVPVDPKSVKNPFVAPQGGFNYRTAAINDPASTGILGVGFAPEQVGFTPNMYAVAPLLKTASPGDLQILSEYNTGYRPRSVTQTDSDPTNLQDVADQALADELTAIVLSITVNRWELDGDIVPVGSIVSVQNPELYLFNKINFFIKSISYTGDEKQSIATYNCTVPEAFNGVVPTKSIFFESNYTNFVLDEHTTTTLRSDDRRGVVIDNQGKAVNL